MFREAYFTPHLKQPNKEFHGDENGKVNGILFQQQTWLQHNNQPFVFFSKFPSCAVTTLSSAFHHANCCKLQKIPCRSSFHQANSIVHKAVQGHPSWRLARYCQCGMGTLPFHAGMFSSSWWNGWKNLCCTLPVYRNYQIQPLKHVIWCTCWQKTSWTI